MKMLMDSLVGWIMINLNEDVSNLQSEKQKKKKTGKNKTTEQNISELKNN